MRRRFSSSLITITLVACGARTALLTTDNPDATIEDSGPDRRDASRDARDEDAEDAPADVPQIDTTKPDVPLPNDCPDADSTVVYLISQQNDLMSFFPPNLSFKTIGKINCPGAGMNTPFSMGVDRKGSAFVVFTDGTLYKVSTLTASCTKTAFVAHPMAGFDTFGMGYSGDNNGELLYVAGTPTNTDFSNGLASIDTGNNNFPFKFIGTFSPNQLERTELTGTGDGRLFGWSPNTNGSGSQLAQIDRTNGKLVGVNKLQVGGVGLAFAFAFWGGDFWIFTSPGNSTTVTKYDPGSQKESTATTVNVTVVGAGVSTCAPQQ